MLPGGNWLEPRLARGLVFHSSLVVVSQWAVPERETLVS